MWLNKVRLQSAAIVDPPPNNLRSDAQIPNALHSQNLLLCQTMLFEPRLSLSLLRHTPVDLLEIQGQKHRQLPD